MGKSKRGGAWLNLQDWKDWVSGKAAEVKAVVTKTVPEAQPVVDGDALATAVGAPAQGTTNIVGGRRTRRHHKKHKKTQKRRH